MYTTQTSKMSYNVIIRIVNCIAYALSMSTFQAANTKCQQFTSLQTRSLVPAVEQTRYKGGEVTKELVSHQVLFTVWGVLAIIARVSLLSVRGEAVHPRRELVSTTGTCLFPMEINFHCFIVTKTNPESETSLKHFLYPSGSSPQQSWGLFFEYLQLIM